MTKSEIISNTLDQLIDKFHVAPDGFELVDSEFNKYIAWQTKVDLNDKLVQDPSAYQRTVVITWSAAEKSITVRIYNSTFVNFHFLDNQKPDGLIEVARPFERYRSNYNKFIKLQKLIEERNELNKTKEFINKISSVFPTILDHFIIGK